MDALAEVASRQRPQSLMAQLDHHSSASTPPQANRSHRQSIDSIMPDATQHAQPPARHAYISLSLDKAESKAIAECADKINKDRLNWDAHVKFIGTLHQGFVRHAEKGTDPASYELLHDLRQARRFLNETIPMGEDMWIDWLTDENVLSNNFESRVNLVELHAASVQEEPYSAQLWRLYGDYMYFLFACSNSTDAPDAAWTEEDRVVGAEIFTWEKMLDVWAMGIEATKFRLNDSNLVWDRYMELRLSDLTRHPNPNLHVQKVNRVRSSFVDRLTNQPHATWEQTFSAFSTFVSTYCNQIYEETMVFVTKKAEPIKALCNLRSDFEFRLQDALDKGDRTLEHNVYAEYLAWELKMKCEFSPDLINGLYRRATTRFHTDAAFWNNYFEFLVYRAESGDVRSRQETLAVLERATKRCPWSGELWSNRLVTMEVENKSFQEIEAVKHSATSAIQVERTGLDDLLKVLLVWCGYLRRRASQSGESEDELDVAEVGIRSALEIYRKAGEKVHGENFAGDPQYRLERTHVRVLFQRGDVNGAIAVWDELVDKQGNFYDFWYRYYIWAMILWGRFSPGSGVTTPTAAPRDATKILQRGLQFLDTMDFPERLIDMYMNHCEQHEIVAEYRKALIETRRFQKRVAERREKEQAEQWAAYYAQQKQQQQQAMEQAATGEGHETTKRKREADAEEEPVSKSRKKTRDDVDMMDVDAVADEPKRDREHSVIVVKNIPQDATEVKVRQFFRDVSLLALFALELGFIC
jgi:hypothetical protein